MLGSHGRVIGQKCIQARLGLRSRPPWPCGIDLKCRIESNEPLMQKSESRMASNFFSYDSGRETKAPLLRSRASPSAPLSALLRRSISAHPHALRELRWGRDSRYGPVVHRPHTVRTYEYMRCLSCGARSEFGAGLCVGGEERNVAPCEAGRKEKQIDQDDRAHRRLQ